MSVKLANWIKKSTLASAIGASLIGCAGDGTSQIPQILQERLRQAVNVVNFGAIGNGLVDDSTPVSEAIATGQIVVMPKGTYAINIDVRNRTIVEGDGSTATIIKPYDPAKAAVTYTFDAMGSPPPSSYWNYHSEFRNVGFEGTAQKTGVGFTFSKTTPSDYQANDEYANNVKFFGCYFHSLEKAVQFTFGNIGSEFYSCGFADNKYGVYSLNNKFGGGMHCGNKYFYGGEFHGNECAIYANNDPQAIVFNGTIFEYNLIVIYGYMDAVNPITPVAFNDCWFEGNGQACPGDAVVVLDVWTGSVLSGTTVYKHAIYTEGTRGRIDFNRSYSGDIYINSTNTIVKVNDSRVEDTVANGGGPCTVTDPSTSAIIFNNPYTAYGVPRQDGCVADGRVSFENETIDSAPVNAQSRWCLVNERSNKSSKYGAAVAKAISFEYEVDTDSGSFSLNGSIVDDGRIYKQCNEYTRNAFASTEYTTPTAPSASFTTTEGWYVYTFDAKRIVGDLKFNIWDRNAAQLAVGITLPTTGKWYTVAGYGYSAGGQTMYLDFQGAEADVIWRMSAYQVLRFDTKEQAQNYIQSRTYADQEINGQVSAATATAVDLLKTTAATHAVYLVSVGIGVQAPANYSAVACVIVDANTLRKVDIATATNMTIGVSGQTIQATQTSGGTQNIKYSVQRIAFVR